MLHDPKWNHGTLAGLITWLEGKPRDGEYNWSSTTDCLMCQYMGNNTVSDWRFEMRSIYGGQDTYKIARGDNPFSSVPQTYGAALERAYAAKAAIVA